MTDRVARLAMGLLLLVHVFLLAWALAGLADWLLPRTPWPEVSNPLFPRWVLLLQWLFILATAAVFLLGYALRWRHMPVAVAVGYAAMAAPCALETTVYLQHAFRYPAMAIEYAAYLLILWFLFRSGFVRRRLAPA